MKTVDADKMCPIHGKPHPLHKCRAFRERPMEDRKTFLKENNLCFKCCSSTHIAKNCKVQFQCFECKSDRHCTPLHPEPTACVEVEVPAPEPPDEIPTPSVALHHAHLKSIAHLIPEMDPNAQIMLLLGRDIIRVHKVRKQVNDSHNQPYAQKLDVGWVVVGNVCLGSIHRPLTISSFYTSTAELQRPSIFNPCPYVFHVKEKYSDIQLTSHLTTCSEEECVCDNDHLDVIQRAKEDNQVAPSIQDASSMKIMNHGLHKDSNNSRVAPLPFKNPRRRLPKNRPLALGQNIEKLEMRSLSTVEAAFDLLKKTQDVISRSNLRLHKIAPNPKEVMEAFPSKDHASDLKDLNLNTDKLTHEVLVTFMAEVTAIINSRLLVPTDRDELLSLTPATLLTQKVLPRPAPAGEFGPAELSKCQSRHVQHLSNTFWDRWHKQVLPTRQARKKWRSPCKNIEPKSIVLLKDRQVHRNKRPLGMSTKTFSSKDGRVRQVKVNVVKPGGETIFVRPVTEMALLLPPDG
ncbi:uncharacterized protein LOC109521985 [Hippocampus comes]|uniref:uncharacterized protein LOC109521985 n=1 Tax=Hippocampus comes TaxID=109280 RepID=UPI00094EA3B0|nr:PREDICTED: uncharacterized protein LOC109521985 [Hippocampus comes]